MREMRYVLPGIIIMAIGLFVMIPAPLAPLPLRMPDVGFIAFAVIGPLVLLVGWRARNRRLEQVRQEEFVEAVREGKGE